MEKKMQRNVKFLPERSEQNIGVKSKYLQYGKG
jgi:hypothetical protein